MGRQATSRWGAQARRRAGSLALTLGITGGFVGLTAAPAAAAAQVTLTPSSGTAGSNFNISGAGFGASEHIKFTWDSAGGSEIAAQVIANLNGQFSNVQATVPSGASTGAHTVYTTGTGAIPSQATSTYTVNLPPGGGTTTTTTTRPTTTTTTHPPGATTTTGGGGGATTTTRPKNSTPATQPTNPAGGTSVVVDAGVGPVETQSQTDVLGESLNDGTTTTTRDTGSSDENALGSPFPAVGNGRSGCTACWGAVAVLLGGVGVAGALQQKKGKRRRTPAYTYKRFR